MLGRNSPQVNNHVEAGLALVKRLGAMRTAAKNDGHTVDHGLVEVAESKARLLFAVKAGKHVDAFIERDEFKFLCPNDRPELG